MKSLHKRVQDWPLLESDLLSNFEPASAFNLNLVSLSLHPYIEVWDQDLLDMEMPVLQRRRFMKATNAIRAAVLADI